MTLRQLRIESTFFSRLELDGMNRKCSTCQKDFTPDELSREESKGMESQRKSMGLEGVLFRY
jgi:hypothetical protein